MPAAEQPKSLSAFIQRSHSEIIGEFSAFARTLMPPNSPMTELVVGADGGAPISPPAANLRLDNSR